MGKDNIPKFRRRNYFIKKGLQTRFVLGFSLAVLVGLSVNLALTYFLIDKELTEELYKIHLRIRTTSEIAVPILWKLGVMTVPVIVVISAVIGYFLTRRIELPLLAFREAVRKTGQGDFRGRLSDDTLDKLPEAFNKMNASHEAGFRSLRDSAGGLEKSIDRFSGLLSKGKRPSKADLIKALNDVSQHRLAVSKDLVRFKV